MTELARLKRQEPLSVRGSTSMNLAIVTLYGDEKKEHYIFLLFAFCLFDIYWF